MLRYLLACLVVLAGAAVGYGLGTWLLVAEPPFSGAPPPASSTVPDAFYLLPTLAEPLNILVMGSDITYGPHGEAQPRLDGNTDTMVLLRVDPAVRQVWGVSIPRDTRVPIPGHGTFKINAANSYGGPELAARTVTELLNVPVNRYVRLNTLAVIQLVDAVGGIDVFIPKAMDYDDNSAHLFIHFKPGKHHLDGKQAHAYLRFRHDDLADIGRIQRQQDFLRAVSARLLAPGTLLQLPELLAVARGNLDTNLTATEILRIARWARGLDKGPLHLVMLPGAAGSLGGASYWFPQPELIAGALAHLRGSVPGAYGPPPYGAPQPLRVYVEDGLGRDREIEPLLHRLRTGGYRVTYSGAAQGPDIEQPLHTTRIIAQTGDADAAEQIRLLLGVGEVVSTSTGDLRSDITVISGQDWLYLMQSEAAPTASPAP